MVRFAKQYMQGHKDIDYFMFGHRHIELDLMLSKKTRLMILGDWIWQFTYAVFDGEHMFMEEYVEGVKSANVNRVFEPAWDQSMMSEEARVELGFE